MPNKRSENQKLVPVQMGAAFIDQINNAVKASDYKDRSDYIREAIREKMARDGFVIKKEVSRPPGRVGKGGKTVNSVENVVLKAAVEELEMEESQDQQKAPVASTKPTTSAPVSAGGKLTNPKRSYSKQGLK